MEALPPILLIEDDANDVFFLQRALKKQGIKNPIQVASNGEVGIQYLTAAAPFNDRNLFPFPGFIITDLKMPKISGLEVLAWLKDHPDCGVVPTIVMSSSKVETDIRQAYDLGANSYFIKPNDFGELEKLLKLIVDYWNACAKPKLVQAT